jgi:hypothetical protein
MRPGDTRVPGPWGVEVTHHGPRQPLTARSRRLLMRRLRGLLIPPLGGMFMVLSLGQGGPALADEWQTVAPVDAGFAPDVGELLDRAVGRGDLPNLHAVVVAATAGWCSSATIRGPTSVGVSRSER